VGHIRQLETLGYFAEGSARELGEETVPEPADDEAVVFEEFFAAGLRMPCHLAFTEILLKYRVQLHQLTPNAVAQLSKYFWAVMSFSGKPSSDGFVKHYELHY
jgi:dimeric dUTPase (all-alpha-NTP-PPase superfamily)